MSHAEIIKKAESDYRDYCEHLTSKLNSEISKSNCYDLSEAYRKARESFDKDPVRVQMMERIKTLYFINPNPNPIIISCA